MRIHGVRLIAVRMSPSRRCQTSWRARPTTADADVGIEGTDDALAEASVSFLLGLGKSIEKQAFFRGLSYLLTPPLNGLQPGVRLLTYPTSV